MNTEIIKPTTTPVVKRLYDPTYNNGCGFRGVWEVYPGEGWDIQKWGQPPLLGYVRADNENWAVYAAYNKGIARPNSTFQLRICKAKKFISNI
jgi:hypothetical protein